MPRFQAIESFDSAHLNAKVTEAQPLNHGAKLHGDLTVAVFGPDNEIQLLPKQTTRSLGAYWIYRFNKTAKRQRLA